MRLSLLACTALMAATLSPVHSLESEVRDPPSIASKASLFHAPDILGGMFNCEWCNYSYELMNSGLGTISHWKVVCMIYSILEYTDGQTDPLDFLHMWYDGDKAINLGQHLTNADTPALHNTELHPPEKVTVYEFKESVDSVISSATMLRRMIFSTAEQFTVSPNFMKEEFGVIFNATLEKLMKLFPPPAEAPGHENRTVIVNAMLDFIEESFLQFAIKLGVSKESLKIYSDPLKLHVCIIIVTIGDLVEQHPDLAMGIFESLVVQILKIWGFHPPVSTQGSFAAWVKGWLFPSATPDDGWFAALQRLAVTL